MEIKQMEEMLFFLDNNDLENLRTVILREKEKLIKLNDQQRLMVIQKTFEKYAVEIPDIFTCKPQWSNLYNYSNGIFTFTNGISIYQLKREFVVPKIIIKKKRKNFKEIPVLRQVEEKDFIPMLEHCDELLGDNKLLVEFESKSIEKGIVKYESGIVIHDFNLKQIKYMNTFLGQDAVVYISENNLITYGESDMGKGYVLGIKK